MAKTPNILISLSQEDAERASDALCQAGYAMLHDAKRSCDGEDLQYANILFNEAYRYLAIAEEIEFAISK